MREVTCRCCGARASRVVYSAHDKQVYNLSINQIALSGATEAFKEGEIGRERFEEVAQYFPNRGDNPEGLDYYCLDCHGTNETVKPIAV